MDVDRLSTGEKIAGVSAILLFVFMFFDWFTVSASNGFVSVSVGGSAWDALDWIPLLLMIAIVAAVGVAVVRLTDAVFEPSVSMNAVVAVLGIVSVLLILYRIVSPPSSGVDGINVDPAVGIFLGLISAAGIAYGGYRAMQEEGISFGDVGDRLGGGSGTPPPPPPAQ
jgi:cation transport ATPase